MLGVGTRKEGPMNVSTMSKPFDMSLVQRGARLRRSSFFEATQRYGPKGFTVYNHTLFPTNFDDFEAEYSHLLNHVTLWDVAVERNMEVTGPDGFRSAQLLTCLDLDGIPVILTRTGWTSEVGYELYLLDASRGTDLWERIMEAGQPYEIRPTGPVDIRRIEGGIFNWGADMTYENNPFELGLDRLVDLDTGADFVAREALARIREEGVKRKIVGLEIDGDRLELNATTWPVSADGA